MTAFSPTQPVVRLKQDAMDVQDLEGLLRISIQIKDKKLLYLFYTRIDQVFILWGVICAIIFMTAQFLTIGWNKQAIIWSILTLIGSWGTYRLAWYWVTVERKRWVVYAWIGLMIMGVIVTNWSIFSSGWIMLPYLSLLWLGLSAIGYLITGWGLRSRAFLGCGVLHLVALALLCYVPTWQFLFSGCVTAGSLFFLASFQWDMYSNQDLQILTEEQKQFNLDQAKKRSSTL
jgi:hypothetical protein